MPGGDRTGPLGRGPMTGRRAGLCAGYGMPGFANPVPGWGFGFGAGRGPRGHGFGAAGRGWRHRVRPFGWTWATGPGGFVGPGPYPDTASTRQDLEARAEVLEEELAALKKCLSDMGPDADKS